MLIPSFDISMLSIFISANVWSLCAVVKAKRVAVFSATSLCLNCFRGEMFSIYFRTGVVSQILEYLDLVGLLLKIPLKKT